MTPEIKNMYVFLLDFEAIPKGRPRLGRGRVYTPSRTVNYEKKVKKALQAQFHEDVITSPLHMNIRFYFKKAKSCKSKYMTKRLDLDNLIKSLSDAMNGIVFHDDSQVVSIDALKAYDSHPRIEMTLYEFED